MAKDWFYEDGGTRRGPITSPDLKKLADSGKLTPETLIWHEGMTDWTPAKSVKGLIPRQPSPAPSTNYPEQIVETASGLLAVMQRADGSGWHPLDLIVTTMRAAVPPHLPAEIARVCGLFGVYAIYAALLVVPIAGVLLAVKLNQMMPIAAGIGIGMALIVLQYVSQRLLVAIDASIVANKVFLASTAVPDSVFVLISTATLSGVLTLLWGAIRTSNIMIAGGAVVCLCVGIFAAIVSLRTMDIGVLIDSNCRAAEEAIGVATFAVRLLMRCVPIVFAGCILYGTLRAAWLLVEILRTGEEEMMWLMVQSSTTASILLAGAAIPLVAYASTLLYYLTLDVISAIVSIPAKLDRLAEAMGSDKP